MYTIFIIECFIEISLVDEFQWQDLDSNEHLMNSLANTICLSLYQWALYVVQVYRFHVNLIKRFYLMLMWRYTVFMGYITINVYSKWRERDECLWGNGEVFHNTFRQTLRTRAFHPYYEIQLKSSSPNSSSSSYFHPSCLYVSRFVPYTIKCLRLWR